MVGHEKGDSNMDASEIGKSAVAVLEEDNPCRPPPEGGGKSGTSRSLISLFINFDLTIKSCKYQYLIYKNPLK